MDETLLILIVLVVVACVVVACVIVFFVVPIIKNMNSPVISTGARVVTKRQDVRGSRNVTSTSYYVTFELADGSREEFAVKGRQYGQLAEGDRGKLYTQGTWYKGFDRFSSL